MKSNLFKDRLSLILIIAGIGLIVFNLYKYLKKGINFFDMSDESVSYKIGFMLGDNAYLIIGLILILVAYKIGQKGKRVVAS